MYIYIYIYIYIYDHLYLYKAPGVIINNNPIKYWSFLPSLNDHGSNTIYYQLVQLCVQENEYASRLLACFCDKL